VNNSEAVPKSKEIRLIMAGHSSIVRDLGVASSEATSLDRVEQLKITMHTPISCYRDASLLNVSNVLQH